MTHKWTLTVEDVHEWRDQNRTLLYRGPCRVPILMIEYHDVKIQRSRHIVPFSVTTAWDDWDVEWCRRDATCYYERVGSSSLWLPHEETKEPTTGEYGIRFHCTASLRIPARHLFWFERAAVKIVVPSDSPIQDPERYLLSRGCCTPLTPVEIEPGIMNPFETDDFLTYGEKGCIYCTKCKDYLPIADPCRHLWWCQECGVWSGPGSDDSCEHPKEPVR